jgi:signal transduction histidine kinase
LAVSDWLRPPRHLVVLFLGIALVLVCTLAWLGWRLFQQDRALEHQRVQVRLEHAADIVAAELTRRLGAIEDRLAELSAVSSVNLPDSAEQFARQFSQDAVLLVLDGDDLEAHPNGRLLYYPLTMPAPEPDASVFAQGEALEFRQRDLSGAALVYRRVAQSRDSAVRAGALLRLARTERKAGRLDAALAAYDDLATLGSTSVGGLPAELVARHASLTVLDGMTRADALERGARELYDDLLDGRWRLSRAQHEYHASEICRWIDCEQGADTTQVAARQTLAAGAEWLWNGRSALAGDGHELTWLDEQPVLAVWHRSAERTVALVGGSTHLARDWLDGLEPTLQQQSVRVAFADVNGNLLTPPLGSEPELLVTRTVADTRLPWTLQVASADPLADFAQLGERRRLMLLGLVTLALFVVVGLYAVLRGVSRELEVARLQSDFVAAVSHEFRTPLTSLRQLAEMLSSGRVASDERRAQYYGIMERESGRLHRLVEGLLDFGRMEAGALEFNWERVTPNDLVRSVVTEFEAELGESGYRVELNAETAAPAVRADSEALGRAVWNLLDNAVKYSPDSTTVRVGVSRNAGRVAIAVSDEGVGIPPAERETIFDKFIRGSSSDGRGVKGTGIGLAMVKHIVEAHGGEVRVESEVGRGSTFTILLPVEE